MHVIEKINFRSVDLNLLVALVALYDEGSVTRAADRLALTQPTVSGMLKRLRLLFDDPLFVRSSHGIVPTPRGEYLAKGAQQVLEAAEGLLAADSFDPARDRFAVTLCGSDYINQTLGAALASDLMAEAPNMRLAIELQPRERVEQRLARGEIDLFFGSGEADGPDLPGVALFRDDLLCLSSYAAHASGQSLDLAEVCALRHIKLGQNAFAISDAIDAALHARDLAREITIYVPNIATLKQVMARSELVCFVPRLMAQALSGPIKAVEVDLGVRPAEVRAYWHPRMADDPRHRWLRAQLMACAARIAAAGEG